MQAVNKLAREAQGGEWPIERALTLGGSGSSLSLLEVKRI
jgi:hypothetical protein